MADYAYDIYPSDNPVVGTRLVRLTNGQGVQISYTHLGHGMGSGFISIHTDHADATEVNLHKRAWCRFVRIDTDPEQEIGGIFLDDGDFKALSRQERGGRILTFRGVGGLSILDRYVLGHAVYATGQPCRGDCTTTFEGSPSSTPDMWDWRQEPYGAMLLRSIEEGQENPAAPFAPVTVDWTRTVDSNGNAWEELSDYSTPIGTSVFALYADFLRMGLVVQCTPDLLIQAYRDVDEFRTDRTSATFAAGKTRFAAGVNILDDLPKRIHPKMERTHVLTRRQNGDYQTYSTGGSGEPYFDFLRIDTTSDATAVEKIATNYLTKRAQYVDQATVRHIIGDGVGQYAPGPAGDYWVLDLATIHTGTDEHDFNNQAIEVAAITYEHDEAGNWFAKVELGAQYIDPRLAALEQALVTTIKQLPANPALCVSGIPGEVTPPTVDVSWSFTSGLLDDDAVGHAWEGASVYQNPGVRWAWTGTSHVNVFHTSAPGNWAAPASDYQVAVNVTSRSGGPGTRQLEIIWRDTTNGTLRTDVLHTDLPAGNHIFSPPTTPANTAGFTIRCTSSGTAELFVSYVALTHGGGISDGEPGDGHPDLVGVDPHATRCDHRHDVHRDTAPASNDDGTQGYKLGTIWAQLDSLTAPTQIVGVWVLVDDSTGAAIWLPWPEAGESDAPSLVDDLEHQLHGRFVYTVHDDADNAPKLLVSDDGIVWTQIGDSPLVDFGASSRDPSWLHWDGAYWLAHTGPSDLEKFTVWRSDQMTTGWVQLVQPAVSGAFRVWAPDWFIDPAAEGIEAVHIFFARAATDFDDFSIYEIHPTNRGMTTWSTPVQVTGSNFPANMIDPFMVYAPEIGTEGQPYKLFYKDEVTSHIEYAESASLTSGFTRLVDGDWAGWADGGSTEAPCVVRLDDGRWRIYFNENDGFSSVAVWYSESVDDWATWSARAAITAPFAVAHGTVRFLRSVIDHERDPHAHPGIGGASDLDALSDVAITSPEADQQLQYIGGTWVNNHRRWEPVVTDTGSGPELVFTGGDIVMTWVDYG